MRAYLLALFIFISLSFQAQTTIRGTVYDEARKPVSDINVTIQEKGRALMLGYVMTDEKGKFKLEYKGKSDSIVVVISGFNVKKQSQTIANKEHHADYFIERESIVLNEVKIKPRKIRQAGDTLNYLVDAFSEVNDRTIGDVLKKMPGIEVKDNGAILYKDRPINKFYIEDADLLQGRYGVATNNIEAKDVSTVQVMENHQPIKALKDREFSEDAAINLKLKDSAKGTLIANAQVGVGAAPLLWNNELTGMYIAKKLQNITTYKGNNSGDDVTREHNSFYSNEASELNKRDLLNVQSPSTPSISEKRYLDNQANTISLNNLKTLKKDYQLTANVNYLNDLQEKSSYAYTEYNLPNNEKIKVEEFLDSRLRKNKLSSDIQLNVNKDKFYLNNLLKLEGLWNVEKGDAITTSDSIYQHLRKPNYGINNTFSMTQAGEKYTWIFYSFNGYSNSSQTLRIQPLLYNQLFDPVPMPTAMVQDVEPQNFTSHNKVTLGLGKKAFKQNYTLGFRADVQHLKSDLFAESRSNNLPDSLTNDLNWNKYEWTFTPNYSYNKGHKLHTSLSLPLSYMLMNTNNKIVNGKEDKGYLHFNPSLYVNYKLSAYWTSFLNYKYSNSVGNINNAYTGYIMSSYRNLLRNDGSLYKQQSQNASLMLNYRNTLTTLFGIIHIGYFHNRANLLYDYYFQDALRIQKTIDLPNVTEGFNSHLSVSKEIESLKSTIFLNGEYINSKSSQMSQGELVKYRNQSFSLSPRILTKFSSKVNLQYRFTYSQNRSKIQEYDKSFDPISFISQDTQLNISPMKGLIVNLKYEYFYNNAIASGNRSMSFGDIGIKYKWNKAELILDYTNIFNSKQFISASYSDVSRYYYSYNLRPAEILFKIRFKLK